MLTVDSNVLIFSEAEKYPENSIAVRRIQKAKGKGILINSTIVAETYHKLSTIVGRELAYTRILNILQSESFIYTMIEKETIIKAIELSLKHDIKINDAIIAQHTIDSKADGILTDNIKDFKKVPKLKILPLR